MTKKFDSAPYFLSQAEYLKISWLNVIPEILCDILFYMCGYVHYRADKLTKDVYTHMLTGQILHIPVSSHEQLTNMENGGWMHSTNGIQMQI